MISIYDYMDSKASEYNKFDPQRVRKLYDKLKYHVSVSSYKVHIVGTNGKGSTGRFIAQSLYESGHSVLHFTSPHLFEFAERFFINNAVISLEILESAHQFLQRFDFISEASYFEYATFLAFVLSKDCDYTVIEAGVGGEYDSTSVLDYDATIFTKIGIDHKDLLGDTLEKIAMTKLRVAQGKIFTHFQESVVLEMLRKLNLEVKYLNLEDVERVRQYAKSYNMPYFLQENLALANLFLESKNISLLKNRLNLRGRCEFLMPNIIIDVGHNEMAARAITDAIAMDYRYIKFANEAGEEQNGSKSSVPHIAFKKVTLIYNSYKNKEVEKILSIFKHYVHRVVIFEIRRDRILDKCEMRAILERVGVAYEFFDYTKSHEETKMFFEGLIESDEFYVVFGSFSLVEQFLRLYEKFVA